MYFLIFRYLEKKGWPDVEVNRVKLERLNVEFKDLQSGNMSQHAFAELILIEHIPGGAAPLCYILKNDKIFNEVLPENFQYLLSTLDRAAFYPIGEVLAINKIHKYILLKDNNSISYNYLIITFSNHYALINYAFLAGIHTLIDALRVRKKIPAAFPDPIKTSQAKERPKLKGTKTLSFPPSLQALQSRKINKLKDRGLTCSLNNPNKRLYEVQV
ncbi:hypothetical protein NEOC84_000408|nr:hypothetical protein [Neochlamydia sp. AcF84]